MARGPGTIIKQTLAAFFIRSHSGCGCTELAAEMDQLGPDRVLEQLDTYTNKMYDSVLNWRKESSIPVPQPPHEVVRKFIEYACDKSRKESQKEGIGA